MQKKAHKCDEKIRRKVGELFGYRIADALNSPRENSDENRVAITVLCSGASQVTTIILPEGTPVDLPDCGIVKANR